MGTCILFKTVGQPCQESGPQQDPTHCQVTQLLLFCNLECILIVFLNIKNYQMILDHSPKEISLFFLYFPTVFCSLWSYGGGRCLCLFNRQSVSMRLENIFLNSQGATHFPLYGCCHATRPALTLQRSWKWGFGAPSFLSVVAHLVLAGGAVHGVSGWLLKSHISSFSVPLAAPHVTVYIRRPASLWLPVCAAMFFFTRRKETISCYFFS